MPKFIPWTDIESFHNVRKYMAHAPELLGSEPMVQYRTKVKLHGTNAAIQCHADGTVVAQSRTQIITPENDNMGFARWVKENEKHWSGSANVIFFGEWCGPGVQGGVALAQIPKKCFAVFAMMSLEGAVNDRGEWSPSYFAYDPTTLRLFCADKPDTYVLPWTDLIVSLDYSKPADSFKDSLDFINKEVEKVEACDPWVESTFGVKGTGEGLVFYPVSWHEHETYDGFKNLCFKAKGAAHRVVAAPVAVSVDPQKAKGAENFATMVLPLARLEQGATVVNGAAGTYNKKFTGGFVQWVIADCQKEVQDELEASGLTWLDVTKPIQDLARKWYLTH
jgi:hypothetical protein